MAPRPRLRSFKVQNKLKGWFVCLFFLKTFTDTDVGGLSKRMSVQDAGPQDRADSGLVTPEQSR